MSQKCVSCHTVHGKKVAEQRQKGFILIDKSNISENVSSSNIILGHVRFPNRMPKKNRNVQMFFESSAVHTNIF